MRKKKAIKNKQSSLSLSETNKFFKLSKRHLQMVNSMFRTSQILHLGTYDTLLGNIQEYFISWNTKSVGVYIDINVKRKKLLKTKYKFLVVPIKVSQKTNIFTQEVY